MLFGKFSKNKTMLILFTTQYNNVRKYLHEQELHTNFTNKNYALISILTLFAVSGRHKKTKMQTFDENEISAQFLFSAGKLY